MSSQNKYLVFFDVVSLFANIPLNENVVFAVNLILANEPSLKMSNSKAQLRKLFHFATAQTHFLFHSEYYDEIDGVAMGSSLGPVLANLFMGYHEKKWLSEYEGPPVQFYKHYAEDISCLFNHKDHAHQFLDYLSKQHACIKFTT